MSLLNRSPEALRAPGARGEAFEVRPDRERPAARFSYGESGRAARQAWPRLFRTCANTGCLTGRLHFWRSPTAPVFEEGWNCSAECTEARVAAAVRREMGGRGSVGDNHRHRIPLGLLMLEQGWITAGQLRQALHTQRETGGGRLGNWLVRRQGVSEQLVTRALSLQWSCPVLPAESHDAQTLTALVPRLFIDAFGALPLRVAAGKLLYLGFEDRLDPVLALAVERMTGLRVECGIVQGSHFRLAHSRTLDASFPPAELIEAASGPELVDALAKAIEHARPVESRLARVHDCFWLRLWQSAQRGSQLESNAIQDVICSLGAQ